MDELNTICPVCEQDISISARELLIAARMKENTGGRALTGCPLCARALVLPEAIPTTEAMLEQWLGNIEDVLCVPLLNDIDVRLPNGYLENLGARTWRPGGGGPALAKRPYMLKYGVDPEIAWAKMKKEKLEPFKIGGT